MPKFTRRFKFLEHYDTSAARRSEAPTSELADYAPLEKVAEIFASTRDMWAYKRRPFFNVWPALEAALLRTSLQLDPGVIPASIVHDLKAIEICCEDSSVHSPFMLVNTLIPGQEQAKAGTTGVLSILAAEPVLEAGETYPKMQTQYMIAPYGQSVADDDTAVPDMLMSRLTRLGLGIMLLASDPEYLIPILLNRDSAKSPTGDALAKAIERARRNGRFGFDMGAKMELELSSRAETSSHFRRPHFALRWTGVGSKIPKLVPVKACIVKKAAMRQVPTGFYDELEEVTT